MKNILLNIFKFLRKISFTLVLIVSMIALIDYYGSPKAQNVSYTQFVQQVEEQRMEQVVIVENDVYGKLIDGKNIWTSIPDRLDLIKTLQERKVSFKLGQPVPILSGDVLSGDGGADNKASNHE